MTLQRKGARKVEGSARVRKFKAHLVLAGAIGDCSE
jgi:hypothetical protein